MPVIDVNLADFRKLLDREASIEELSDRIPMMGIEWEGTTGDGIQLQIFPNRPDLLSIEGLARAYNSFMGYRTGFREYDVKDSGVTAIIHKKVEKVRPYFVTAVVKNIDFDAGVMVNSLAATISPRSYALSCGCVSSLNFLTAAAIWLACAATLPTR